MKKTLKWIGITVGSVAVFAGAGLGMTLVNKDSLATHLIEKYTGNSSSSDSSTTSSSSGVATSDSGILDISENSNVDSILSNGGYNGSAAINTSKKILVSSEGYGDKSAKKSMSENSMFLMGKIQDTINNGIILHLVDTGEIKLSDKLSKYDKVVEGADSITVKQVMNQTSGIDASDLPSSGKAASLVKEVNSNATFDSANQGSYSDSRVNTILQAAIIEKVTGNKYRTVVQDLIDQLGLENTTFGLKKKTVNYYDVDEAGETTKVGVVDLDTAEINRMGSDQLVSSTADIAQLYGYIFNSDFIRKTTINKMFGNAGAHAAGFAVDGNSISLAQGIAGGRNRIEWDLKKNEGTFLFSNYIEQDNLSSISANMFDYLK